MPGEDENCERLVRGLRAGDPHVLREFCALYGDRLHRLADRRLGGQLRRRVGPEDVVQSAYRTFLRRLQGGEFQLLESDGLSRLLCAITLRKLYQKARAHQRHKRDLTREVPLAGPGDEGGPDPVDRQPLPDEAAAFADQFEQLLAALDPECQQIVDLKLQGLTNEEVAERLGSSERTVRRLVKKIQRRLEAEDS